MALQMRTLAGQHTARLANSRLNCFRPASQVAGRPRRGLQQWQPLRSADPSTEPSASTDAELDPESETARKKAEAERLRAAEKFMDPESETARKKAEAERLRAAEKFMVIGSGTAQCKGCGYEYSPEKGDPDFPISKGVRFQELPEDYICPICGATKDKFESRVKVVAGFAENQQYGLGTNSMTGEQKSLLIYGALAVFFILFLGGYALN